MSFDTDILQRLCALMEQQLEETRRLRSDVNDGFDRINARIDRMNDQLEDMGRKAKTL